MNNCKNRFPIALLLAVIIQSCDPVMVLTIHNKASVKVSVSFSQQRSLPMTMQNHGTIYTIPEGDSLTFGYGLGKWTKAQKHEVDSAVRLLTLPTNVEAFRPQPWKKKAKRKGLYNNMLYVVIKE